MAFNRPLERLLKGPESAKVKLLLPQFSDVGLGVFFIELAEKILGVIVDIIRDGYF